MRLHDIAHARAGDKGDTSNISLIAYHMQDYEFLSRYVTAERVRAHFGAIVTGAVERYELPGVGALNFVLHGALAGGVTRSLNIDSHGKTLSSLLLAMELPELAPEAREEAAARERVAPSRRDEAEVHS
jgi:hypothetical protein